MLYEGNVVACIQIVDNVSISTSVNFTIHVLIDPNDGSKFTATDDFTEFQKAVISLTTAETEAREQMEEQAAQFEEMQIEFNNVKEIAENAHNISQAAQEIAEQALATSNEALETIIDFTSLAKEIQTQEQENSAKIEELEETVSDALNRTEAITENVADVAAAVREVAAKIGDIKCDCGLKEEEVIELIEQELANYVSQDDLANYATIEQLANYITQDQVRDFATLGEVDEKLRVAVEEAQGEHQAI
jgi:chromosome segregation ATPase